MLLAVGLNYEAVRRGQLGFLADWWKRDARVIVMDPICHPVCSVRLPRTYRFVAVIRPRISTPHPPHQSPLDLKASINKTPQDWQLIGAL